MDVFFFDFKDTSIEELRGKYEKELCVTDSFWKAKEKSRYATLIVIDRVHKVEPFSVSKKGMQTWVQLPDKE